MIASAALALVFGLQGQTPAVERPFSGPFEVAEPNRLALTPTLDGRIDEEEWDVLATGADWLGAFQWEPRKVHIGGKIPLGKDLVVSLDQKSNGWLVGKDNLEVRFTLAVDGKVSITARYLDGTSKDGPRFVPAPGFEMAANAVGIAGTDNWVLEATLEDPNVGFLPTLEDKISVRYDILAKETAVDEAFLPRALAGVKLVQHRSVALPVGLKFKPEPQGRMPLPGEPTKIRLTFEGTDALGVKDLSTRAEGPLKDQMAKFTVPFPSFDKKGRAFIDYSTPVAKDATIGFRVLRGTLGLKDGPPAQIQTSLRIPPLVEFEVPPLPVPDKKRPQTKRIPIYIQSFSTGRVDGEVSLKIPETWQFTDDNDKSFIIYNSRGRIRKVFEVLLPVDLKGTFPLDLTAKVGKQVITQKIWLTF